MKIGKINCQSIGNNNFTSVLQRYERMPQKLYIAGDLPNRRVPTVAIVGSRRPTPYGKEVTAQLARDLSRYGVVVVSGLALGIDAVAHKATLEAGGTTIAVLANGLHRIYPASHTSLAEHIVQQGGVLLSEKEQGYDARGYDFLARNRIISGLADAIIVTEATEKSGTLSTVAHALDQNKEVFAVPGPITSLLSAGPNRLLQQGAHVALNAEDILRVIAPQLLDAKSAQTALPLGDTPLEQSIIDAVQRGVTTSEALLQAIPGPSHETLQAITMLELNGALRTDAGHLSLVR